MANIIGIDVSKLSLDCAYLRDVDQQKAKRKHVLGRNGVWAVYQRDPIYR